MVEHVEATPIDTELDTISRAEQWLSAASERVSEKCALYKPPEQITTAQQYKDAKASRAQFRKDAAEIDNERKAMLREMEDRLKQFKAEVKDVLLPLTDLDAEYKAHIEAYEEMLRTERHIELAQEFEELAPGLAEIVPFDLILSRYGNERGKAWINQSTNVVAAKQMLADAIEDVAEKEKSIDSLVPEQDRTEVKALFFSTLDLNAALSEARRIKEQRERVEELERARATYVPEPVLQEPAQAKPQQTVADAPVASERPVSNPHPWVIDMVGTWEQANMVADFMRRNGIVFNRIYNGTIADAYMKGGYYDA